MPESADETGSPSYEELAELVAVQKQLIEEQTQRIARLEAELEELRRRVGRNPRNSSIPPSAEGLGKPVAKNRAERRAEKRRQGKQPGAEGKHLAQVAAPDEIVVHAPESCRSCGGTLDGAVVIGVEVRQVFELPEMRAIVTEHRIERRRCGCGCETKAEPPAEATAPACYGPGVRALVAYLAVYQHLPYDRLARLLADVLRIEVSVGAIAQMVGEAGGALGTFSEVIAELLKMSPAVHFDETGGRVGGRLQWIHVASTTLLTLLECHPRRGVVAMDEMGILEKLSGVAIHDGWKPYRTYDVVHGLCNAHHLRELQSLVEAGQTWADEMIGLLIDAKRAVDAAKALGATCLDRSALHSIRVRYGRLIQAGWQANPLPADRKRAGVVRTAANLLARLDHQRSNVLRFATDFAVSFDNNQAERDLRMVKLQQKISGSWRTLAGAQNFCAIRSYVSTMRKHDADIFSGLRQLFEGSIWLPSAVPRS
ncbi:MAG TPA: IS66 family transposase [Gaiellaceae bacterium]|nr:IS66 family transposase [Gaiellaceae bacterium]